MLAALKEQIHKLPPHQQQKILANLGKMPDREKAELFTLLQELSAREKRAAAQGGLLDFVRAVYPGYKIGPHHKHLARLLEHAVNGDKKRIIVNIAPRMGKSELVSYLFPAWFLGHNPDKKIIMGTHTADLSVSFGRRVRDLVNSEEYRAVFPNVHLNQDAKAAGQWNTSAGGQYYAAGVGGALAGRGADVFVIDDPHALTLDTEVPTTSGFKTIADIQIGDKVFGPDGRPTRVIAKSEVWENREIYEVVTDDGAVIECDGGHLWNYRSDTKLTAPYKNATTRQLAGWNKASKPCLPRHASVQYPYKKLPIDPYVLGAWLGDGTTGLGRMTSHPDDMPFMRQQFEQAGYVTTTLTDSYSFGVKKLREHLHKLGIRDQKAIPAQYLLASVPQRMALLQGLMDTDGDVTEAGQCSFNNTNQQLAEQFRTLIHSLGVKAKLHRYEDKRPGCSPVYRVTFKLKDCCRLPRKNARTYTPTDKRCRSIEVRKTTKKAAVQCITVDRTDGLFLAGREYVVTHNSEQEAKTGNPEVFLKAWEWFQSGPLQRLMPNGVIIVIMTRWSMLDLTGQLVNHMVKNPDADQWEVVEFPAILDENLPTERSLWPEFWPLEELKKKRAGMDVRYWSSQYLQNPTAEGAQLIKREWWRYWEQEDPPECEYTIMSLDAAQEAHNRADYNAVTLWGVFYMDDPDTGVKKANVILLNAWKERMEFPELKRTMLEEYKEWEPDTFIVEKKSSGAALYQEFRSMGIPVSEFTPSKGNDKIARVNAVSDLFRSGIIWAPTDRRWAQEVIEECTQFPVGAHDDYVDSMSAALLRFRKGGFIRLPSDYVDEQREFRRNDKRFYAV